MKTIPIVPAPPVHFTATNVVIVLVGTLIMAIGLYRIFPLQLNRQFLLFNGPLMLMLVTGIAILYWRHTETSFTDWGKSTSIFAGKFLPLMVLLCLVMAVGGVITKIHEQAIQDFLLKHHVIGPFIAALVTPTSNALVPVVESAWRVKSLQPMCLYYLQASVLMSIPLFSLRQIGFRENTSIPLKMYVTGMIISVLLLVFMKPTFWLVELVCERSGTIWSSVTSTVRALI